ncbi:hypothetical protein [uncultured Polaribacter sp.]|uniref:hypothetical protein n=1 Tax=uncultured Polaribacter sp. TaxID=174711 RepID=UPI00261F7B23|nr:hypothetical protein [uncultured Polaribacter sp.]
MKKIGSTLIILGLLAIVLNFANRVPRVLLWIYFWGETTALGIKIAIVIVGFLLWNFGKNEIKTNE